MKNITSSTNPEVKKVVQLHDKKGRVEQKLFIVEGEKNIGTFIQNKWLPVTLYITNTKSDITHDFVHLHNIQDRITFVTYEVMKKMSTSINPSGVLGLFPILDREPVCNPGNLVLADISDPGNMGTLIRTAAALQCPMVLVIDGCDPLSPKVVQASAGAHALVPIAHTSWQELFDPKKTINLCALVVSGGNRPEELDLKNSMLIVGSEAHGIPSPWVDRCAQKLTLPMPGNTESLNAAVAGSLALYERYRSLSLL